MSNRPVEVELLDTWTRPVVNLAYQPGLDRMTYLQVSPTYNYGWWRSIDDNRALGELAFIFDFAQLPFATWPPGMPARMPVDWSAINSGTAGGPVFTLHHHDEVTGLTAPVPHPYARQVADALYSPVEDGDDANVGATAYHEDISAANHTAEGPVHIRLSERNRDGGTWLERPLNLRWHGVPGGQMVLVLEDNDLFVPFDLREPGRYAVLNATGTEFLAPDASTFMRFRPGELWRVHLRPQFWWFDVWMLVHYEIVTPFISIPSDEVIRFEGAMRPPVWPYRHNLLYTRTIADVPSFFGAYYSWDPGINAGFQYSALGVALSEAAHAEEYHTLCMAKVFLFNEQPWADIWTDAPRVNSIVAAFDHVDRASGEVERFLLMQVFDHRSVYPDRIIGSYLLDFTVA